MDTREIMNMRDSDSDSDVDAGASLDIVAKPAAKPVAGKRKRKRYTARKQMLRRVMLTNSFMPSICRSHVKGRMRTAANKVVDYAPGRGANRVTGLCADSVEVCRRVVEGMMTNVLIRAQKSIAFNSSKKGITPAAIALELHNSYPQMFTLREAGAVAGLSSEDLQTRGGMY